MARYCFLGHVDPARLDAYRAAHAAVWPELLVALRDAGWRNYSLFLRPDGLLIGYCESDDLDLAQAKVAATEVNARWQDRMAELFASDGAPDESWEFVDQVFNLEDQLAAVPPVPAVSPVPPVPVGSSSLPFASEAPVGTGANVANGSELVGGGQS